MSAWGLVEAQDSLFKQSPVPLVCVDADGHVLDVNQAATVFLGLYHPEQSGINLLSFVDGCDRSQVSSVLLQSSLVGFDMEVTVRRFDASTTAVRLLGAAPTQYAEGRYARQIALIDISRQRQAEECERETLAQLNHVNTHDALTGLPNRYHFEDRLIGAMARCNRDFSTGALIFVDVDRFKFYNELYGHNVGDEILKEVARRLVNNVREQDTVCRYSGDEFILIMENVDTYTAVDTLLNKLRHELSVPVRGLTERPLSISAAFGATLFDHNARDVECLVLQAETAMLRAKRNERNRLEFYSPNADSAAERRRMIEHDLGSALAREQFSVVYQPQFRDGDQRLVGCEALLRWSHPDAGQILPGEFIEVAEDTRISSEILRFVLNRVCRDARKWLDDGLDMARVSVNVSALDLSSETFADEVEQALRSSGLPADRLEIEVTETSMMRYPEAAALALGRLSKMGVSIALDDFGTGYSSLSCFMDFPFDRVKIDQAFVRDLPTSRRAQAVVRAVSTMVDRLSLDVVAEGIETDAQRQCLRDCGVDQMQGFLFAHPMDEPQFRRIAPRHTQTSEPEAELCRH